MGTQGSRVAPTRYKLLLQPESKISAKTSDAADSALDPLEGGGGTFQWVGGAGGVSTQLTPVHTFYANARGINPTCVCLCGTRRDARAFRALRCHKLPEPKVISDSEDPSEYCYGTPVFTSRGQCLGIRSHNPRAHLNCHQNYIHHFQKQPYFKKYVSFRNLMTSVKFLGSSLDLLRSSGFPPLKPLTSHLSAPTRRLPSRPSGPRPPQEVPGGLQARLGLLLHRLEMSGPQVGWTPCGFYT